MTHDPSFEPEPAVPPKRMGYRTHPPETWGWAKSDYADGHALPTIARAYGIALNTVRDRARREGWRRSDTPSVPPVENEVDDPGLETDPLALAEKAWRWAARAVEFGDRLEARAWLRIAREFREAAREAEARRLETELALEEDLAEAEADLREEGIDPASLPLPPLMQARLDADPTDDFGRKLARLCAAHDALREREISVVSCNSAPFFPAPNSEESSPCEHGEGDHEAVAGSTARHASAPPSKPRLGKRARKALRLRSGRRQARGGAPEAGAKPPAPA